MDFDQEEIIEKFRDFEKRSHEKFSDQYDRIKSDRTFLSGSQWDADDDSVIKKDRARQTINIVENSVNAVVNNYTTFPFTWYSGNSEADQVCAAFLKEGSNARAAIDSLQSAAAFGLGVIVLSTEKKDGVAVPTSYSVPDVTEVMLDPDSVEIDGSDAVEGAIVELRSKKWISDIYGDDYAIREGTEYAVDISGAHSKDTQPVVSYYRLEDSVEKTIDEMGRPITKQVKVCNFYRLLGNSVIESECATLPISRIPIFPVFGERTWLDDDKQCFQGIVRKSRSIQKIVNYSFTQLGERLAMSPKPAFMASVEAVEGLDEGYRNFTKNANPLLMYNRKDGKDALEKPQRLDNTVQYSDLSGIIQTNLGLMQSVTGIDAKGIVDTKQEMTATEVMYNAKAYQTNIRHYYDNLRDTFKSLGETFLEMIGLKGVSLDVIQGPDEYAQRQVARQELTQLAGIVPETMRPKIVNAILMTHSDNAILMNLFSEINAQQQPSANEQALQQQVQQLQQQVKTLTEENEYYKKSSSEMDKSLQSQFMMEQLKHKNDLDKMAFQAQLDGTANTEKQRAEIASKTMELQKQAIQLDAAKAKATAEIAKANASIFGGV